MALDKIGFGKELQSIRKGLNLTIEEASFLAGVSEKTIYRIEHGINKISINTLDKLSVAYKKDLFAVYNKYVTNPEIKLLNLINRAEKSLYIDDLKNIEMCINELKKISLKQFTSYKKLFIKHYIKLLEATYVDLKYSDRSEAIKFLIDAIKSEIYDFNFINFKNFNYSPIEMRLLMNTSTWESQYRDDYLCIDILTFLLPFLEEDNFLYPKTLINLSTLHYIKGNYKKYYFSYKERHRLLH